MCVYVCVCAWARTWTKLLQSCQTLITVAHPWGSPGKNTGVICYTEFQGIFLPNPRIEPASLTSPALVGRFFTTSATWEAQNYHRKHVFFPDIRAGGESLEQAQQLENEKGVHRQEIFSVEKFNFHLKST